MNSCPIDTSLKKISEKEILPYGLSSDIQREFVLFSFCTIELSKMQTNVSNIRLNWYATMNCNGEIEKWKRIFAWKIVKNIVPTVSVRIPEDEY